MLSRVADSLYWMSRYLERAEHMARLGALRLTAAIEQTAESTAADWRLVFEALHMDPPEGDDARRLTEIFILDRANPASMLNCVSVARDNARQVREHISGEMWEQLNRQFLRLRASRIERIWQGEPVQFLNEEIEALFLFHGLAAETMSRSESWHFIEIGRYIERAQLIARLTDLHMTRAGNFDGAALLKMAAAFEAYCRVHTAMLRPAAIIDFLALEPNFPHSIRFCADAIAAHLAAISPRSPDGRRAKIERIAGRLTSLLDNTEPEDVLGWELRAFLNQILDLAQEIHDQIYAAFIDYPIMVEQQQ